MCPTWVTAHRLELLTLGSLVGRPRSYQEARAVKTVKISGRVAKPAWDKTVGGVHCIHCTQSLQTGSQLGPNLAGMMIVAGLAG